MRPRHVLLASLLLLSLAALIAAAPTEAAGPRPKPKPSPAIPAAGGGNGELQVLGKDGKVLGACPLQHTDVRAEISGFIARVEVTQQFVNLFAEPIEAVYVFPLPQDAAVNDMTMRAGGKTVRGVIRRREEAQKIYQEARRTGRVAALLDQERPNIFTQSVANILPGETVTITIEYLDVLKYEAGAYEFLFPTVVGPRYIPGSQVIGKQGGGRVSDTDRVPDASRITPPVAPQDVRAGHDINIEVRLDAGVAIQELRSELHDVLVDRTGPASAIVRLKQQKEIPNRDFILRYDVAGEQVADALLVHATPAKVAAARGAAASAGQTAGYFTFILQPPERIPDYDATPRELVFVLDTSGSMHGFPIEKAKETMALALSNLRANDTFNLITFAGDTRVLFDQPVPATKENLQKAQAFLASRSGSGGTEMMKAIRAALAPTDQQEHVRIVCFMTDGYVGNEGEIIAEIQKHSNARVFAFGVGNSVNRFLLDNMAREGRGEVEYVTLQSDGEAAVQRFEERVRTPLLTDVELAWNGLPVADVQPSRPGDLFSAKPLVITGRYTRAARGKLTLRGRRAGQPFSRDIQVELPAEHAANRALAPLWARRKIDDLMARDWHGAQQGAMQKDVQEQVTQLGLDYRLMTQFTSFVAVEERIVNEGGQVRTIQVPVEVPDGVNRAMAVGEEEKDRKLMGLRMAAPAVPQSAAAGCNACAISTATTVEVTEGGGLAVDTTTQELSQTAGGGTADPRAAEILARMTNQSTVSVVENFSSRRSSADGAWRPSKDERRRQRLEETFGGKVSDAVLELIDCAEKDRAQAASCAPGGKVRVRIVLTERTPAVLQQLAQMGLTQVTGEGKTLHGELPVASLKALAEMKQVFFLSRAEPTQARRR